MRPPEGFSRRGAKFAEEKALLSVGFVRFVVNSTARLTFLSSPRHPSHPWFIRCGVISNSELPPVSRAIMLIPMKTTTLTVRGCGPELRRDLQKSARSNKRSLNGETLAWLEKQEAEKKPVTCAEAADILRRADRVLNRKDREQIASGIEEACRRMNNEHLH